MRIFFILLFILVSCTQVYSSEKDYYCFSSGSKSVLLVPSEYPNINSIMYYPFMKKIELSTTLRIEEVDMGIMPSLKFIGQYKRLLTIK